MAGSAKSRRSVFKRKAETPKTTMGEMNKWLKSDKLADINISSEDINKDPFYLKLCLMNARVKVFAKNFNHSSDKLKLNLVQDKK